MIIAENLPNEPFPGKYLLAWIWHCTHRQSLVVSLLATQFSSVPYNFSKTSTPHDREMWKHLFLFKKKSFTEMLNRKKNSTFSLTQVLRESNILTKVTTFKWQHIGICENYYLTEEKERKMAMEKKKEKQESEICAARKSTVRKPILICCYHTHWIHLT